MTHRALWTGLSLAGGFIAALALWQAAPVRGASEPASWDRAAAARYLDSREVWWQQWPKAQKDHGTVCISCHTNVPYAMVRPALQRDLGESQAAAPEAVMMASVEKRVDRWTEMVPFYSDAQNGPGKTAQAHSTEAVMNAIVLASYDAQQGHLRPVTRKAFDEAWALQLRTGDQAGGWLWQNFHLGPFEAEESGYYGAALLMVEVANAPDDYARQTSAQEPIAALKNYLRRQYAAQPVMNKLYVLWASRKIPELLNQAETKVLLQQVRAMQQADGGWRLAALDPRARNDNTEPSAQSDGYATALTVLAMEESGIPSRDATLQSGLHWLVQHQQKTGDWRTASLNSEHDMTSDTGRFMSDAATGYAVLALQKASEGWQR